MSNPMRIDTHQHMIPPAYRKMLDETGRSAAGWTTPKWDPAEALAMMERESIATGVLSLSAPGVHFGDDGQARDLARIVNEYGADLVHKQPDRFGLFACLPLPDVAGAIAEATHAFDVLKADGVVLLSNAGGAYLGDAAFAPLWAELDARSAVVFIHPTQPPIAILDGMPGPLLDYPFDTTRTAIHMVANGVLRRHRRIRVILSHGGGFLPYAAQRFVKAAMFNPGITEESVMEDMKAFYFDTALTSTPTSLPSFLAFADPARILFGSDFPFEPSSRRFNDWLDNYEMTQALHEAINRKNAQSLFPRLARV